MKQTLKTLRLAVPVMVMILLFCMTAMAQETVRVVAVEVSGNANISSAAILATVGTKVGEPFSDEQVEKDIAAIKALGYFTDVTSRTEDVPGGRRVIFEVAENPRITQIVISGNTAVPNKDILDVMQTKIGEVLNTQTLSKDVEAIVRLYGSRGFPAEISDVTVDSEGKGILTITILEARIESIRITGLKKTREYVVRRELKTKPGDLYNAQQISRDINRAMNLNIFEDVSAKPETGSEIGKVVLVINVTERKTGQVQLGFGYSGKEGLVGRLGLQESNFRGRGQGANFSYEVGGRSGKSSFELGFYEPWLDKKHTSMSASVYDKIVYRFPKTESPTADGTPITEDYFEMRRGGTILFARPFGEYNRVRLGFRGESVKTHLPEGPDINIDNLPRQNGTIFSTTLESIRDTRDLIADPTSGSYLGLSLEPGHAKLKRDPITGISDEGYFTKYGVEYRRYIQVFSKNVSRDKRRVLAVRGITRYSNGVVPFFEQFFVGGAETLRGYQEDWFWGRKMLLVSTEARVPVSKNLQGVVFVDAGDAWGASQAFIDNFGFVSEQRFDAAGNPVLDADGNPVFDQRVIQHKSFKLHLGYGVGLRVKTPIGPLRLDYGFGSEGSRLHFSIGQVF